MINTFVFIGILIFFIIIIIVYYRPFKRPHIKNSALDLAFQSTPCDNTEVYCQTDGDCGKCKGASTCKSGRCMPDTVQTQCDVKSGFTKFLVGNAEFGKWLVQCLSTDPGIATKHGNNMCRNGNIEIDYTKKIPVIADCQCDPVYVPATSNIREYAVCNDKIADLIKWVYGY